MQRYDKNNFEWKIDFMPKYLERRKCSGSGHFVFLDTTA